MTRRPRGMALPAALAAVIVLAALAALASVAARASLRESAALADEAQSVESRANLRARATRLLTHVPFAQLLAAPHPLGLRDTLLSVSSAAWPWYRLVVSTGGTAAIAEFARAIVPPVPWCAASVVGGFSAISPGALSIDPADRCAAPLATAAPAEILAFADSLDAELVLPPPPDTLVVTQPSVDPVILRAQRRIELGAGASTVGVLIAPVVRLTGGAVHRGVIIASDTLILIAGSSAIADSAAVTAALRALARIRSVGRAGLLLPP